MIVEVGRERGAIQGDFLGWGGRDVCKKAGPASLKANSGGPTLIQAVMGWSFWGDCLKLFFFNVLFQCTFLPTFGPFWCDVLLYFFFLLFKLVNGFL